MCLEISLKVKPLRLLKVAVVTLVAAYLVLLVGMAFFQERLIFFPRHFNSAEARDADKYVGGEPVAYAMADGTTVRGWHLRRPGRPVVVLYGGNATELSDIAPQLARGLDVDLLAVNYRGYGASEGKPGQDVLVADALAVLDRFAKEQGVPTDRISLLGISLGSGVAMQVAAKRPVDRIGLVVPFDSLRAVAQERYPFMPVGLLLRHPFDSTEVAPSVKRPVAIVSAGKDLAIPSAHADNLATVLPGHPVVLRLEDCGHNDTLLDPACLGHLKQFFHAKPQVAVDSTR